MQIRDWNQGLVQLADGLWAVEHHRAALGLHTRMRMSVARLDTGGLCLYSPVPISDALAEQLSALGPVEHLVAPNRWHHLFAGPAKERFADARLWAAPGLSEKRADLSFDAVLPERGPSPFGDALDLVYLEGTPVPSECVLFHRASGSLLCCDFLFNVHDEQSLVSQGLFRAMGVWRTTSQSRPWRMWTRDREAARRAVDRVLSWDVRRVVMAHGDVVEDDARALLERATGWLGGR